MSIENLLANDKIFLRKSCTPKKPPLDHAASFSQPYSWWSPPRIDRATTRAGTVALNGVLEESLFLGAHYRHYIRLGDVVVMADSPELRPAGPVRLVLPADKLQVYGC